jgi:serine O-acetyltransferase
VSRHTDTSPGASSLPDEGTPGQPIITRAQFKKSIQDRLRATRPGLRAILPDAAAFCANRGERIPVAKLGRLRAALRLCWQADDFLALVLYRLRTTLLISRLPIVPRLLHFLCGRLSDVRIGDNVLLGAGVYIPHGEIAIDGLVRIGHSSTLCPWITIDASPGSIVGPTLAEGVFVGTGAMILGDVTIGAGAQIGANAVVHTDVPAGATAVGVPARIIEAGANTR